MKEMIKFWFEKLYKSEIFSTQVMIKNEHVWELGYNGEEPNPHTGNIEMLKEYIEILEKKLEEIKNE